MKKILAVTAALLALAVVAPSLVAQAPIPLPWAYAIVPPLPPGEKPPPLPFTQPEGTLSLPGSPVTMTRPQIFNAYDAADWWPMDHPEMVPIVKNGRREAGISACALCHYPNGKGKPDNSAVSGLPEVYFIQQMLDYRSGARKSTNPKKANAASMGAFAKAMTDAEIAQAAAYFASIKYTPWIRVVETTTVPRHQMAGQVYVALEAQRTTPLGNMILEVPEDAERFEGYRDPRSGFVAYVPPGTLKKGEALATTGGKGRTTACGVCHGADLRGLGPVPAIAGRSPSYLARQLVDMRTGARAGAWSGLMKSAVEKLTDDDILALAAYAASKAP